MNTRLNALQFDRSFNYMSKDLANVMRDWKKVVSACLTSCPVTRLTLLFGEGYQLLQAVGHCR
jgi:hypothetical protein